MPRLSPAVTAPPAPGPPLLVWNLLCPVLGEVRPLRARREVERVSETVATPAMVIPKETLAFYRRSVDALLAARAPFLVGGSYAFERYTGIARHSKDFDIFAREQDVDGILTILEAMGSRTERTFPHWLAKAYQGEDYVDVIYGGGSGIAVVDDEWFEHAVAGEVLGARVQLIPAEEMIWSKGFVMERERYDGADIAHVILRCGRELDWDRLLRRFEPDWRVLLSHVVMFGYVHPSERDAVPRRVVEELSDRLRREAEAPPPREKICRGPVVSRLQYLTDIRDRGYADVRLVEPRIHMNAEDVELWTKAALAEAAAQVKK